MQIKQFKQLSKKDVAIAGGKGASLGEMTQAKLPIPPGFVILVGAFDAFLEETDLDVEIESILKKVKVKDINSVEQASEKIHQLILDVPFPKELGAEIVKEFTKLKSPYVAVRSSATAEDSSIASWAGELETYLNTTKKDLLTNVKKCWASLFTPRAIFYRFEKKMHKTKVSVAVVIQKMVQSEVSGICFTVHPVTKNYNQMVIEAGFGLGEAIVGGLITPDTYVLHKKKPEIVDTNISEQRMAIIKHGSNNIQRELSAAKGSKQKLSNTHILKLTKICLVIEKHYKKPQDIEWAFEKGKFYITQSRPITTL